MKKKSTKKKVNRKYLILKVLDILSLAAVMLAGLAELWTAITKIRVDGTNAAEINKSIIYSSIPVFVILYTYSLLSILFMKHSKSQEEKTRIDELLGAHTDKSTSALFIYVTFSSILLILFQSGSISLVIAMAILILSTLNIVINIIPSIYLTK